MHQSPSYRTVQDVGDEEKGIPEMSRKQQHRQTLIPSDAFGFDARNGDPNMMTPDEHKKRYSYADSVERLRYQGNDSSGIELVTVPALGSEFTKEEVKAMKKPYKRRKKARQAGSNARRWVKSDGTYLGCLSPVAAVFTILVSLGWWVPHAYWEVHEGSLILFALLAWACCYTLSFLECPVSAIQSSAKMHSESDYLNSHCCANCHIACRCS